MLNKKELLLALLALADNDRLDPAKVGRRSSVHIGGAGQAAGQREGDDAGVHGTIAVVGDQRRARVALQGAL